MYVLGQLLVSDSVTITGCLPCGRDEVVGTLKVQATDATAAAAKKSMESGDALLAATLKLASSQWHLCLPRSFRGKERPFLNPAVCVYWTSLWYRGLQYVLCLCYNYSIRTV